MAIAMPGPALAHGQGHEHEASPHASLKLDHGRKWATDEALRAGMGRIRATVAPQVSPGTTGSLTKAQYSAMAASVQTEIGTVVANCKLAPEADANLHVVLGEIVAGTEAMAGKTPGVTPRQGLLDVATALNEYARYFDHPGFAPIRVPR